MASLSQYYPGNFWSDVAQSLAWIHARQNPAAGNWQANAAPTATHPAFAECGIDSIAAFSGLAQAPIENVVINPPPGVLPDSTPGPDGFPINYSPQGLPTGNILLNTFLNASQQSVTGSCFSLLQPPSYYRVDVFARTDQFYYQGSAFLNSTGPGQASWSVANASPGAILAVLYPSTAPLPSPGEAFPTVPSGWIAHSNTGMGPKLTQYFARIYVKTDIEYLQEDNIPIIVEDSSHARCGSSVIPAPGTMTVHIIYEDPVAGPIAVYTSLEGLAAYQGLPRSFIIPTSDPLYVPDVTASNAPALQNRSFIYDAALFMIAACGAGNFNAAQRVVRQLNYFLDNPSYLASLILENAEDGKSAGRWTKSNPADSVTDVNDPTEPPYGTGLVVDFHATAANDSFTYSGAGFPDSIDTQIQFEHRETSTTGFVFDVSVTTKAGSVTDVQVSSAAAGPPSYNSSTKIIILPIGPGTNTYQTHLINLQAQIASLANDSLTAITGFKVTLTSAGDLYFDNLSVGGLQPANSLAFSYDTYYGQIDQPYIRAGAMAWVCYAYCIYMAMSQDWTPALYLQRMINFLLTLQSPANDLTNGLFYLGYGKYQDPGYQFIPGLIETVSTEHQADLFFAFMRAADVLPTAATQLMKTGQITSAQAQSLAATAAQVAGLAPQIWTKLLANLYIQPNGTIPGRFAQGATANALDTSEALDASGTWAALLANANGRDDIAAGCLEFVYQNFFLLNQQIAKSNQPASWNEAYQQLSPFSGFMPYQNSAGGYSGVPLSVWQEGTWSMILALLRLHNVAPVQTLFQNVAGSLDDFLNTLIGSQYTVRNTTGDGSFLGYSLAARGLPWEFEVWPMLSPTCWFWITAVNPGLLLSAATNPQTLPYLVIPQGASQTVDETNGMASVGKMTLTSIDPGGVLKSLVAQQSLLGQVAQFSMGFPGQSVGDFVPLHTLQITSTGWTAKGQITIECDDVQRFIKGSYLWLNGGPAPWAPGDSIPMQPSGPQWLPNAFTASSANPRYLQGNPIDLLLAALQNELGVGQDPALPRSQMPVYASDFDSTLSLVSPTQGAGGWQIFVPGDDSTLINPNLYLDVPGMIELRDSQFSGDWFEFKITQKAEALQWIQDQILKILGLYFIVRSNGQLSLKSMKTASAVSSPVVALNSGNIVGIPSVQRGSIINVVNIRMDVDDLEDQTAAMAYNNDVVFEQQDSINTYRQLHVQQIEAKGLRVGYGGMLRASLLADRLFRRHAYGTPEYTVNTWLSTVPLELGDYVWLSHPLVPDLLTGEMGVNSVICEVSGRRPDYARGRMQFTLLDTRFMNLTKPYQIAPAADNVPAWSSATSTQRSEFMFISLAAQNGEYSDGTVGDTIF
ncbi:MAG TPA: hypothetical protein VMX16_02040 [Terriglobia bacterium]|nr:hypothetical protein [Terriglobia bacterium]